MRTSRDRLRAKSRLDSRSQSSYVRSARKDFFRALLARAPDCLLTLLSIDWRAEFGRLARPSDGPLPEWSDGRWLPFSEAFGLSGHYQEPQALADLLERPTPLNWRGRAIGELASRVFEEEFDDAVFVPTVVAQWATEWNIAEPWVLAIATLVRARSVLCPEQSLDEALRTLPGYPHFPYKSGVALRADIDDLGDYPALQPADPRIETQAEFLGRARQHFSDCADYFRSVGLTEFKRADPVEDNDLLVRVVVLRHSISDIARERHATRQAIDVRVRTHAKLIGLAVRLSPGRPSGRRENAARRRSRR